MLNRQMIGKTYPPQHFEVEKQRLCFFAKATGQTDPIYYDEAAAIAAGHPSLLAPPTFLTTVPVESRTPFQFLDDLGVDISRILHTAQDYQYAAPVYAGDRITLVRKIANLMERRGSERKFIVMEEQYTNQRGEQVATATVTLLVR